MGFRFTVEDIARSCTVVGWVRNLRDGRVELVAEAEESKLKEFIFRIEQHFRSYIQDLDVQWQEPTGEFIDFRIRF